MKIQFPDETVDVKKVRVELLRFMMAYKFAVEEVSTKINILQQEFQYIHEYNPIEHVKSRVKTPESILKKINRKGYDFTLDSIRENVRDIAGIRITCSFISDIYEISRMLQAQKDIQVVEVKDYIKIPKPNGYRSLHLIIQIPIFMSDREDHIYVEIQIRTIAMDFWASLEHKIYYKYNQDIPVRLVNELKEAAISATELDKKMENIHREVNDIKENIGLDDAIRELNLGDDEMLLPFELVRAARYFKKERRTRDENYDE